MAGNESSTKWYRRSLSIILLIIIFFPVGLYLMWRYANWNKRVKWTISGIYAFLVLAVALTPPPPTTKTAADQTTKAAPAATPKPTVKPTVNPTLNPTPTAIRTPEYKILDTRSIRPDGAKNYYIQMQPLDLSNDQFKKDVKVILADMVAKHGEKLSILIFDNKDSYDAFVEEKLNPKGGCIYDGTGNIITDQSVIKSCLASLDARMESHFVTWYDGQLSTAGSPHELAWFPSTFTTSKTVGKYVGTEDFNPKAYKG